MEFLMRRRITAALTVLALVLLGVVFAPSASANIGAWHWATASATCSTPPGRRA